MIYEKNKTDMTTTSSRADGFRFGQYFLEKRLAHGGMAEVFVGKDTESVVNQKCVVKCILPDLATDAQFLAMFLNEAQLAAQMAHPNVVKVLDFGEQDGLLYMVMEFVEGLDCWRLFRRAYPFGENHEGIAVYIITEVLRGLDYVHNMRDVNGAKLHVVHRDMSPSNIYLSNTGEVKLGDFGIAHIDSPRYRAITYTPRGKFGYVAPEQIEGRPVGIQADIFSVGIVLGELLVGQKLFQGPSQLSVLLEIRDGRFVTLEQNADKISPSLLRVLKKALSLEPVLRYQSATSFRSALLSAVGARIGTRSDVAEFVQKAREIGEKRRTETRLATDEPPDVVTSAATDVVEKPKRRSRRSLPIITNQAGPSVWDIIGEDIDDLDEFDSFDDFDDLDETPITNDYDVEAAWQYTVELGFNNILGPVSFATVMELICEDKVVPETLISLNDGPFAPASSYPELARHIPVYTPTLNVEEIKNPDRRGVFTVDAPSAVILSLAMGSETGLLICKHEKRRKEVFFRGGKPVYASSNDTNELLGVYLVSQGVINENQHKSALEMMPRFDGHIGDTLVAMGMVSGVNLFRAIADQIKMRFRELLFWRNGVYEFFRDSTCRQNEPEIPIEPYTFITEALASYSKTLNEADTFGAMKDAVVEKCAEADSILERLSISGNLFTWIRDLREPTALQSLLAQALDPNDRAELLSALYIAVETGIWSIDGPQLPWRSTT